MSTSPSSQPVPAATARSSFFAHHGAWAPGVRMFRVMGFKAKAAWISAAFLLPLMLVFGVYLRNQLAAEAFAKAEVQGVAALKVYLPLIRSVIDWRDAARAAEGGVDLKAELGDARQRTERAIAGFAQHLAETGDPLHFAPSFAKVQAAHQLAAAAPRPIDAAGDNLLAPLAEAVMAAQADLGDKSNLTLDPDADSFYTQAALVMELPGLASDLGHLRAWATYLDAKGLETPKLLRRYIGWDHGVLVRSQTVADDLKRAVDATPEMGAALDAKPLATVLAFRQHAARLVLDGEAGDAKQLWGEAATAMDALFGLCDRGLPALDAALLKRIDGLVTERRVLLAALALSLLAAAYLFASFYRVMRGGLAEVRHHLRAMTDGDLTTEPRPWGRDEAANLMLALQAMQGALRSIVGQVRGASDSIVLASGEIAAAAVDLSNRTERTAADLEQSASAMEEISSTVRHTAGNAKEVAGLAAGNAEVAARGGEVIGRVVSTMQEIQGSSRQIADIVGVIDSIAFQTNILALNAAVEAARAGEQGRGFAVVASEVRALAQRSAGAAKEIKGLIAASVGRVDSGMQAVQGAGTTMQELVGNAQRMNLLLAEISVVANQQSVGVTQVGATVQNLDQMTQQNAALVEQSSAAATTMNMQAKDLAQRVAIFKLPLAA